MIFLDCIPQPFLVFHTNRISYVVISAECFVESINRSLLSFHFNIVIPDLFSRAMSSPRFSFLDTTSAEFPRRFFLRVPTKCVFFVINFSARSTLVYQLSVQTVWPLPNTSLQREITISGDKFPTVLSLFFRFPCIF